jgi:hypothetical protein
LSNQLRNDFQQSACISDLLDHPDGGIPDVGHIYPRGFWDVFVRFSQAGELWLREMYGLLGLASWHQVTEYRRELKTEIGISNYLFDGDGGKHGADYDFVLEKCRQADRIIKRRKILATSYLSEFQRHGDRDRGTDDSHTGNDKFLIGKSQVFHEYQKEHRKDIAKAIIVIAISPLSPEQKPFLLCFVNHTSGQVSVKWRAIIEGLTALLRRLGFDVIWESFHGDPANLKKPKELYKRMITRLAKASTTVFKDFLPIYLQLNMPSPLLFPDLFELAKILGNRFSIGVPSRVIPFDSDIILRSEELGLNRIPFQIRTPDPMKKMDDRLPKGMICPEYLRNAWNLKRPDLIIALPLTTLLLRARLDPNLTRVQTFELEKTKRMGLSDTWF